MTKMKCNARQSTSLKHNLNLRVAAIGLMKSLRRTKKSLLHNIMVIFSLHGKKRRDMNKELVTIKDLSI